MSPDSIECPSPSTPANTTQLAAAADLYADFHRALDASHDGAPERARTPSPSETDLRREVSDLKAALALNALKGGTGSL